MLEARDFYDFGYRHFRMPWELGPRSELVLLFSEGRLPRGRAIDLGCGTGANSIYLAQQGFDVTGIDFAPSALRKAKAAAASAGVRARFEEDDLTNLRGDYGTFDLLVDYGTLDDLSPHKREKYMANVIPLARPGSLFLLWEFEWQPRTLDRWARFLPMEPGEIEERFSRDFDIERVAGTSSPSMWRFIPGFAAYLMTRRG